MKNVKIGEIFWLNHLCKTKSFLALFFENETMKYFFFNNYVVFLLITAYTLTKRNTITGKFCYLVARFFLNQRKRKKTQMKE